MQHNVQGNSYSSKTTKKKEEKLTSGPTLLGQESVLITILTGDVMLLSQVLGSDTHGGFLGEAIDQSSSQRVLQLQINSKSGTTEANTPQSIGRERHGLGSTGQDNVGITSNDLMGSVNDRLETRSTETVDGKGGDGDVEAGAEADVAGEVGASGVGVGDVSDDDRVDGDLLADICEGGLGSEGAQLSSGVVLELSACCWFCCPVW